MNKFLNTVSWLAVLTLVLLFVPLFLIYLLGAAVVRWARTLNDLACGIVEDAIASWQQFKNETNE